MTLTFPSAQTYDLAVRDADGNVVASWSLGILFAQGEQQISIPRGEKTWALTVKLPDLKPGIYTVEGWLTTSPIVYKASSVINLK